MKKVICLCFCLLLVTGCNKQENKVKTIVQKNNQMKIAINYPITNVKRLDQKIQKDVKQRYQTFLEQQKEFVTIAKDAEFNIDYTYDIIDDRYIMVVLKIFSNSNLLSNPMNDLNTYVYDKKEKKFLTLSDVISPTERKKVTTMILKQLKEQYPDCLLVDRAKEILKQFSEIHFTFDEEQFYFYFEPYEITAGYFDMITVSIPIEKLGLTIDINEGKTEPEWKKIETTTKIIDPNQKSVALTFDDGPSVYTEELLNILKKYDASGTFFVIGNKVEIYSDTMRRMVQEGNEIGNHSYNHKWLTKVSDQEFLNQINQTQQIVKKVTGFTPRLMRPTYGAVNQSLRKRSQLKIVMWDVDTRDWESHNIDRILKKTVQNTKDGSIILMHDTKKQTVTILEKLLKQLKEEGYQFVTVSELDKIKQIKKYEE